MQPDTRPVASLQLGVQKYLYTGYFVAGCLVAYVVHNGIDRAWPDHDLYASLAAVAAGIAFVTFAWKNTRLRTLAQETIDELALVTWPSRQETYNATVVVIVTAVTCSMTIFLLDWFWTWFTDWLFR